MTVSETRRIRLHGDVEINAVICEPASPGWQPDRSTVVFLHFWGGSARTWSLVTPHVAAKHRTVALDFRGWGDSTGPDIAEAYSIAEMAEDVEATIRMLGLRNVLLVGLSMGAKVAQLVASRFCSSKGNYAQGFSLLGLLLLSPAPPTPLRLPPQMREQQIHAYDSLESAAFVAKNVLTASFKDRSLPEFVVEDMVKANKWAREAWPMYAMEEDISEQVVRITVSATVVGAGKDPIEPVERIKSEVCDRIVGSELHLLPESGHLSPLDAPEEVTALILSCMSRLS